MYIHICMYVCIIGGILRVLLYKQCAWFVFASSGSLS